VDVEFLVDVRVFGRGNHDRDNWLRCAVIGRSASNLDGEKATDNKLGGIFFGVEEDDFGGVLLLLLVLCDLIGEVFWLD
jgi:hypothetical protein